MTPQLHDFPSLWLTADLSKQSQPPSHLGSESGKRDSALSLLLMGLGQTRRAHFLCLLLNSLAAPQLSDCQALSVSWLLLQQEMGLTIVLPESVIFQYVFVWIPPTLHL